MRKIRVTAAVATVAALGGGLWIYGRADAREAPAYRFATVERGDLQSTVSATGALSAVTTVQVGTQVSGQISAIYVDFNDKVKKGQLLARIDPTLQQQAVQDAGAGVERARAQLTQAESEYQRNKALHDQKIVTDAEFNTAQSNYAVARANLTSAQVALDKARQNLAYTSIHAPIDGVVVERNVDVGQTVAASLQAPQLFLIANDLSRMQILASVDESDIGSIKEGQPVTFTVQSYADKTFTGEVRQVRLQSATTDNVVNYTAVVSVANPDGQLLPGMTATVKFLTNSADGVLTVPNAALRFRPATATVATATGAGSGTPAGAAGGTAPAGALQPGASGARRPPGASAGGSMATLWTVDASGKPTAIQARTGLTDGQRTQVQGAGLDAGARVIVGTNDGPSSTAASTSTTRSPFQQQQSGGPPRPPGAF
jgi:HlyD family secretion protein